MSCRAGSTLDNGFILLTESDKVTGWSAVTFETTTDKVSPRSHPLPIKDDTFCGDGQRDSSSCHGTNYNMELILAVVSLPLI